MKAIAAALLVVTAAVTHAQSIDPTGHWKGSLEIPNNPMDFEMDLGRNARGELIGTLTAGVDHVTLPLLNVTLQGSAIAFYGRTDQQFHAELLQNGKTLSGSASLGGYELSFSMTRSGEATIDPPPTSAAVGKDLEGLWHGALSAGGRTLRVALTIENQADGTSLAHSVSLDEGGLTMPAVVSQSGRSVKIETRGVITAFVGTLNAAGTELSGTWTQGATSLPLAMTRTTPESTR
jgi:hypothetical protein